MRRPTAWRSSLQHATATAAAASRGLRRVGGKILGKEEETFVMDSMKSGSPLTARQWASQYSSRQIRNNRKGGMNSNDIDVPVVLRRSLTPLKNMMVEKDPNHPVEMIRSPILKENVVNDAPLDATPFLSALDADDADTVEALIDVGALSLTTPLVDDFLPLHLSVTRNALKVSELLLKRGADVLAELRSGLMPIHLAAETGNVEMLKLLVNYEADVNLHAMPTVQEDEEDEEFADWPCFTPLHLAIRCGHLEATQYLVESAGASCDEPTIDGFTPMQIALMSEHMQLVAYLASRDASYETSNSQDPRMISLCAVAGDVSLMKHILENRKLDINAKRPSDESTALHAAVEQASFEIIMQLLEHGADINALTNTGFSPLHVAVQRGDFPIVALLVERGANLEICSPATGKTPLCVAIEKGDLAMTRLLVHMGANLFPVLPNGMSLARLAVQNKHLSIVAFLQSQPGWSIEEGDSTLLHIAAQYGALDVVRFLMEPPTPSNSVPPLLMKNSSWTPLHCAVAKGHLEVCHYLLTCLSNEVINQPSTPDKRTALHEAILGKHSSVVELLLNSGRFDVHAFTARGEQAIHLASQIGDDLVLEMLLRVGGDNMVHALTNNTQKLSPLHIASEAGHWNTVKVLLMNGANVDSTEAATGRTPLHLASMYGHDFVVHSLIESGSKLETKDFDGMTPLLLAAQNGQEFVVRELLRKGALLNAKNNSRQSIYDLAKNKRMQNFLNSLNSANNLEDDE